VKAYGPDLAYIHDDGYGDFARQAAPGLLALLRDGAINNGLIVDLGCGSGIWAHALCGAGYHALGIDISKAMIALARRRAPEAEFRVGSLLNADIPPCAAVTSIGECVSFLFDHDNADRRLLNLFRRIHASLKPGGLLIFDAVTAGRVRGSGHFREGPDWAVFAEAEEDRRRHLLTRRITSFRKIGQLYRREFEVHHVRLFNPHDLAKRLRNLGFRVRRLAGYGDLRFGRGHFGVLARKV
jgi:SAM-dependent methyltransferase